MRFETAPGERAQVDWGSLAYLDQDGRRHRIWVFVMTIAGPGPATWSWSGLPTPAAFIQCHVNAFDYLCGVPRRCVYNNAKVVTLGLDEDRLPICNRRMLDFALRV